MSVSRTRSSRLSSSRLKSSLLKALLATALIVPTIHTLAEPTDSSQAVQATPAQLNINTASADALMGLIGIGPTKAAAILSFIEEHGKFRSVDELTMVSGIGPRTLEQIRPYITVE